MPCLKPASPGPHPCATGKVDMSCAYPRGGMRPNPPIASIARKSGGERAHGLQQENNWVPRYHTAASFPHPRDARLRGLQNRRETRGPWSYSTMSSAASSTRNLDHEQSTVTWRRYLVPCVFGSASLLSQDVSYPKSQRPYRRPKRKRTPFPRQEGGKSYRLLPEDGQ